jgi:hypothetical protein
VVVPELALRTAEFRYEPGIQIGFPKPRNFLRFDVDPELFWKLPSSRSDVDSLGFIGDEIPVPKPPDTYRILFLGDSMGRGATYTSRKSGCRIKVLSHAGSRRNAGRPSNETVGNRRHFDGIRHFRDIASFIQLVENRTNMMRIGRSLG